MPDITWPKFTTMEAMKARSDLTYANVSAGQIIEADGLLFTVLPMAFADYHFAHPAANGVLLKSHQVAGGGYDARAFGIVDDGSATDDHDALQRAINMTAKDGVRRLRLPSGHFYSSQTLRMHHHPVANPDFPDTNPKGGMFHLEGQTCIARRANEDADYLGTAIELAPGAIFSASLGDDRAEIEAVTPGATVSVIEVKVFDGEPVFVVGQTIRLSGITGSGWSDLNNTDHAITAVSTLPNGNLSVSFSHNSSGYAATITKGLVRRSDQTDGQQSNKRRVSGISFIGHSGSVIKDTNAAFGSEWEDILVSTDAAAPGVAAFELAAGFVCKMSRIEIIGDPTLASYVPGSIGLHLKPGRAPGGGCIFDTVTVSNFDDNWRGGDPYTDEGALFTSAYRAHSFIACQGKKGGVGFHAMGAFRHADLTGCWFEQNDVADVLCDNGAAHLTFSACNISGNIQIGGNVAGTANSQGRVGANSAGNITVKNTQMRAVAGEACIVIHSDDLFGRIVVEDNMFYNGGGVAIAYEGARGGFLELEGNNYEGGIEGGGSAFGINRRVALLDASADRSYFARKLDYSPTRLAGDLDMSGWHSPPEVILVNTLSAASTITLPALTGTNRKGTITVMNGDPQNDVTITSESGVVVGDNPGTSVVLTSDQDAVALFHGGQRDRWFIMGRGAA